MFGPASKADFTTRKCNNKYIPHWFLKFLFVWWWWIVGLLIKKSFINYSTKSCMKTYVSEKKTKLINWSKQNIKKFQKIFKIQFGVQFHLLNYLWINSFITEYYTKIWLMIKSEYFGYQKIQIGMCKGRSAHCELAVLCYQYFHIWHSTLCSIIEIY